MPRKISSFDFTTLNGFFKGPGNDISWNRHSEEESKFSIKKLEAGNMLLFGRVTYEMMEAFWTSQHAYDTLPVVAALMNKAEKIVFSNSLKQATWKNTSVMSGDIIGHIRAIKQQEGKDMSILGSGTIVSQFADAGLIDDFEVMVYPVVIPAGTPLFSGIRGPLNLQLAEERKFSTGTVLLVYHRDDPALP